MIKLRKPRKDEIKDFPKSVTILKTGRHETPLTAVELIQLKHQLNNFDLCNIRFGDNKAEVCITCTFNKKGNVICDFCNEKFSKYRPL